MQGQATDATFITRLATEGHGITVAVKDVFDVEGVLTTNGCRAVADHAQPAATDAPCLAGLRAAGARIVGKANMHELGFGTTGLNPWYGTPVNPRFPDLVPGGSSSGPAVAVARGEVDLGLGTDTGGSVRFPAGCCGIAGLKTTWGRFPMEGVAALAPTMDSIGPLARDVAGLGVGMALLEPGFALAESRPLVVGRIRISADPAVDDAIDRALSAAAITVVGLDPLAWNTADDAARVVLLGEVHDTIGWLARDRPEGLGDDTLRRFASAAAITAEDRAAAEADRTTWHSQLEGLFGRVDLLALPTMVEPPPPLSNPGRSYVVLRTRAANLAGVPGLSMPVPTAGPVPASLQLVGPWGREDELLRAGLAIEDAIADSWT
ncbi:MAG: amidase [Acidobacteria bacterium]|nr:amidase [Acidobacteriota bacterium]